MTFTRSPGCCVRALSPVSKVEMTLPKVAEWARLQFGNEVGHKATFNDWIRRCRYLIGNTGYICTLLGMRHVLERGVLFTVQGSPVIANAQWASKNVLFWPSNRNWPEEELFEHPSLSSRDHACRCLEVESIQFDLALKLFPWNQIG